MIKPAFAAVAASLLTACAGHATGPVPVFEQADTHQIPYVSNDGFYDGGVFDHDSVRLERNRPSLTPSL